MNRFDVQAIEIRASYHEAFSYISDPQNLPLWTGAFETVSGNRAVMRTHAGNQDIFLTVNGSKREGTIDWVMKFQDGSEAKAFSRLVEIDMQTSVYTFLLLPPPVALEELEGTLELQSVILKEELLRLQTILNNRLGVL